MRALLAPYCHQQLVSSAVLFLFNSTHSDGYVEVSQSGFNKAYFCVTKRLNIFPYIYSTMISWISSFRMCLFKSFSHLQIPMFFHFTKDFIYSHCKIFVGCKVSKYFLPVYNLPFHSLSGIFDD